MGLFSKLKQTLKQSFSGEKLNESLTKTRKGFITKVFDVFTGKKIDEDLFEELEEVLIQGDVGVKTAIDIVEKLRLRAKEEKIKDGDHLKEVLVEELLKIMGDETPQIEITPGELNVILVVGVNGVGKTTSIGKLAHKFKNEGKKVLLAAGDTFRAAAIDQLKVWGQRVGVDVIAHKEGADPGAVVFDAIQASKARKTDVLIVDTAGRLHNKANLMEELKKVRRIIDKETTDGLKEVLLVLDATTGQNALAQAKTFSEVTGVTGVILTKLDGTAKGGIIIGIKSELNLPVKFIGVGEKMEDLQVFKPRDFIAALFSEQEDSVNEG